MIPPKPRKNLDMGMMVITMMVISMTVIVPELNWAMCFTNIRLKRQKCSFDIFQNILEVLLLQGHGYCDCEAGRTSSCLKSEHVHHCPRPASHCFRLGNSLARMGSKVCYCTGRWGVKLDLGNAFLTRRGLSTRGENP